jgi:hypothetical protein
MASYADVRKLFSLLGLFRTVNRKKRETNIQRTHVSVILRSAEILLHNMVTTLHWDLLLGRPRIRAKLVGEIHQSPARVCDNSGIVLKAVDKSRDERIEVHIRLDRNNQQITNSAQSPRSCVLDVKICITHHVDQ